MRLEFASAMRLQMAQTYAPRHMMCMLPLFSMNLHDLKSLKQHIKEMSEESLEFPFAETGSGTGAHAFKDYALEDLVKEASGELTEPDVALERTGMDNFSLTFLVDSTETPEKENEGSEKTGSLVRSPKTLLKEIEWVMKTTSEIYRLAIDGQKAYLQSGDVKDLHELTEGELAEKLGISPGTVSRLIEGKSIRELDGTITPLRSLFMSQDAANRAVVYRVLAPLLKSGDYNLTDDAGVVLIAEKTGLRLARRTIAKYRLDLQRELNRIETRSPYLESLDRWDEEEEEI